MKITIIIFLSFVTYLCLSDDNPTFKKTEKTKTVKSQEKKSKQEEIPKDLKLPAGEKNGEIEKKEPILPKKEKLLIKKISEIIAKLENEYPSAIKKINKINNEKVINDFLKTLNMGIRYADNLPPAEKKKKTNNHNNKPFKGITISDNRILYFRLDEFSPECVKQLKDDCINTSRLANKPVGIIIDLRNCDSYENKEVINALALFCKKDKISSKNVKKSTKRVYNLPMMILVGEKTCGDGEIFSSYLSKAKQCLIIGDFSSGKPYKYKSEKMNSGGFLLFPNIPEYLKNPVLGSLKPDIAIKPYPQVEYNHVAEETENEHKDKCLLRAIDLLVSLHALGDKWKK